MFAVIKTGGKQYRVAKDDHITVERINGEAGDIVFWHHRLGHMASPNISGQLRQAVLYDFHKADMVQTQLEPPQQDMWRDWSGEIRAIEIEEE